MSQKYMLFPTVLSHSDIVKLNQKGSVKKFLNLNYRFNQMLFNLWFSLGGFVTVYHPFSDHFSLIKFCLGSKLSDDVGYFWTLLLLIENSLSNLIFQDFSDLFYQYNNHKNRVQKTVEKGVNHSLVFQPNFTILPPLLRTSQFLLRFYTSIFCSCGSLP